MKIMVKDLAVDMEVKNKGIELEVRDSQGHLGDLVVSKGGLTWCRGKTTPKNGKRIGWDHFVQMMESV